MRLKYSCPRTRCMLLGGRRRRRCRYGFRRDKYGCLTCTCKRRPAGRCPAVRQRCRRVNMKSQCSKYRSCPRGLTCCPGVCGIKRCLRLKRKLNIFKATDSPPLHPLISPPNYVAFAPAHT
ncbi:antistasin-like [Gigantopelta aegis]|uniref:antistasin-like n=1 Tax=Gigantopelta aegis TaxID=1735272 RepID=UPI001B88DD81|nr:antistasin-like [Gigantopelta aegis]